MLTALLVAACSGGGNSSSNDTVTVNGDVPLAYVKRSTSVGMNPTDAANTANGGDLMLREKSSPSATEHNLTERFTQGKGDASDPEVSYDGKKIVFAMRCDASNTSRIGTEPACTGRWNIWEYDMTGTSLTGGVFRRLTSSTTSDDVDPVYLPANRGVIFSSNRQEKSSKMQALGKAYFAADEYERERVMNLHSMAPDGSNVQQISFNQSHERNPVIRPNGDIMFSRWEHVADRNRFAIFRSKPDGTDMFVFYGAQSQGNSYLHPRDMDPKGKYKGQLISTLMSLSGTQEGGALKMIDAANYSEDNTPANKSVAAQGGQVHAAKDPQDPNRVMADGRGLSLAGRATTPYPLWDGSDRVLVAYRPCEITRNGVVASCLTLTDAEKALMADNTRSRAQRALDAVQDNAPSAYAIYMFDPAKQTWLIVAAPPSGFMLTDPVALIARSEPNVQEPTTVDPALAARNMALIEVRSVYDTDGLNRMAEGMLVASDRSASCTTNIPQTAPHEAADTRGSVADLAKMKDPADPAYNCAPARFVRALRGVPPPAGGMGARNAIGETDFEQVQIVGYAPIEPDGSFKLEVPADVPLALSVLDAEGRAIQTHTNWIQVRPGERRTCDGCHSPRRGAALNSGPVSNTMPAAMKTALSSQHQSGETLASLRTRLDPSALTLQTSPVFAEYWADTSKPGVTGRSAFSLRYTGNTDAADDLQTAAPVDGVINYPEHIQPLWERARGASGATCVGCHNGSGAGLDPLDLRATVAGTGRTASYETLLLGKPVRDAQGNVVTRVREGELEVVRGPALVNTSSGDAGTAGQARKSRLAEILWGQQLKAGAEATTAYPNPPAGTVNHATLLNKAEKRLLAEWMDGGGQYYNNPFDSNSGVRTVSGLSQEIFLSSVMPVLQASCATCHAPGASRKLVLTGSREGDFNNVLSLINDTCRPASNPLITKTAQAPHAATLLPAGSAGYNAITSWIQRGCPTTQ